MRTTIFKILLLSSFLLSGCFRKEYDRFSDLERGLFFGYNQSDTFKLRNFQNQIFTYIVTEKNDSYDEQETFNIGTNLFFENGWVYYSLMDSENNCGSLYADIVSGHTLSVRFGMQIDNNIFDIDINIIDHNLSKQKIGAYTISDVIYKDVYEFVDTIYNYNKEQDSTYSKIQKLYLNTENGIIKMEDEATGNIFTIVE